MQKEFLLNGTNSHKIYDTIGKTRKKGVNMQVIKEKELPEREALNLVTDILKILCKKGLSFRQTSEILDMVQLEIQKLPISE